MQKTSLLISTLSFSLFAPHSLVAQELNPTKSDSSLRIYVDGLEKEWKVAIQAQNTVEQSALLRILQTLNKSEQKNKLSEFKKIYITNENSYSEDTLFISAQSSPEALVPFLEEALNPLRLQKLAEQAKIEQERIQKEKEEEQKRLAESESNYRNADKLKDDDVLLLPTFEVLANPLDGDSPLALTKSVTAYKNTLVNGFLDAKDLDDSPINLTFKVSKKTTVENFTLNSRTGEFKFTPPTNFLGTISIPFTVSDGIHESSEANLNILIKEPIRMGAPQVELFDLTQFRKVDILFVIDNSTSMKGSQKTLETSFAKFIQNFSSKNLDFQIAAISTDIDDKGAFAASKLPGKSNLLTSKTPNLNNEFKSLITLGTGGSSYESAMLPLIMATESPSNKNFFREDAFLSVVIVSDEDESLATGAFNPREYIAQDNEYLETYKNRALKTRASLLAIKNNKLGAIRVDSVIALDPLPKGCTMPGRGIGFDRFSKIMNGRSISICNDFSAELSKLGDDISKDARNSFALKKKAIANSIRVSTANGIILPQSSTEGWIYDESKNVITINGEWIKKIENTTLKIDYFY